LKFRLHSITVPSIEDVRFVDEIQWNRIIETVVE
jgi:hypothetical protein